MTGVDLLEALRKRFADLQSVPATTWARRQDDASDRRTRFIYTCLTLERVYALAADQQLSEEDTLYAAHRWKNFTRHEAWLDLVLASMPAMRRHPNARERHVDFWWAIGGVEHAFDLKVTRWPRGVDRDTGANSIVSWLYGNQSREGRHSLGSRLFVVGDPESKLYDFDTALRVVERFSRDPQSHLEYPPDNASVPAAIIVAR